MVILNTLIDQNDNNTTAIQHNIGGLYDVFLRSFLFIPMKDKDMLIGQLNEIDRNNADIQIIVGRIGAIN